MDQPRTSRARLHVSAAFAQGDSVFILLSRSESDGRKRDRTNVHLLKDYNRNKYAVNGFRKSFSLALSLSTSHGTIYTFFEDYSVEIEGLSKKTTRKQKLFFEKSSTKALFGKRKTAAGKDSGNRANVIVLSADYSLIIHTIF